MQNEAHTEFIDATGVSKHFGGITALSDAAFHGRAGKTTFIQILAGVVRPDGGVIEVKGLPFCVGEPRKAQAAGISAVFQELSLIPDMTVEENIWFRHEQLSVFRTVKRSAMRKATLD